MRRGVSGLGFIVLILACATVVYLALEAFQSTERALSEPVFAGETVLQEDGGAKGGSRSAPPPLRPSLRQAQQKADAHASELSNAIRESP